MHSRFPLSCDLRATFVKTDTSNSLFSLKISQPDLSWSRRKKGALGKADRPVQPHFHGPPLREEENILEMIAKVKKKKKKNENRHMGKSDGQLLRTLKCLARVSFKEEELLVEESFLKDSFEWSSTNFTVITTVNDSKESHAERQWSHSFVGGGGLIRLRRLLPGGAGSGVWTRGSMIAREKKFGRVRLSTYWLKIKWRTFHRKLLWKIFPGVLLSNRLL